MGVKKTMLPFFFAVLIFFTITVVSLRLFQDPLDLVSVSLDKHEVRPNERLTLNIRNYGFHRVESGSSYKLFHIIENGTLRIVNYYPENALSATQYYAGPFFGSIAIEVYTDLEAGNYILRKNLKIVSVGEFSKDLEFKVE